MIAPLYHMMGPSIVPLLAWRATFTALSSALLYFTFPMLCTPCISLGLHNLHRCALRGRAYRGGPSYNKGLLSPPFIVLWWVWFGFRFLGLWLWFVLILHRSIECTRDHGTNEQCCTH